MNYIFFEYKKKKKLNMQLKLFCKTWYDEPVILNTIPSLVPKLYLLVISFQKMSNFKFK